jgi:hypothetical protein
MTGLETYSHNGAKELLEQKGILKDVHSIPAIYAEHAGQYNYSERSAALDELGGWQTEIQIDLGPEERSHNERLTPLLDIYHPQHRVAVEHETKEQMRARWHLMKIQGAAERNQTLPIDVCVLIFPTDKAPSLRRTRRELTGPFFTEHFPIHIPVYAIEYGLK